jgi:hypothetical protein
MNYQVFGRRLVLFFFELPRVHHLHMINRPHIISMVTYGDRQAPEVDMPRTGSESWPVR